MNGVPYYDSGILVSDSSNSEIRRVAHLDWQPVSNPLTDPISLSKESFLDALEAGSALYGINSEADKYTRVKKGFDAWKSGIGDFHPYGDARLHQFVRASEAFLKVVRYSSRKDFVCRSNLISENSPESEKILKEIYNLRSCAEHMNDFEEVLENCSEIEKENIFLLRTHQAQLLASNIYKNLFANPILLKLAESDNSLENLWSQPDNEILNLHFKRAKLLSASNS